MPIRLVILIVNYRMLNELFIVLGHFFFLKVCEKITALVCKGYHDGKCLNSHK